MCIISEINLLWYFGSKSKILTFFQSIQWSCLEIWSKITECFCRSSLIFLTCLFSFVFSFLFVYLTYDALLDILYVTLLLSINVFVFLNFNKPVKFIKTSIAYNEFIFTQLRRNHFRYFYIWNRYIYFLSVYLTDLLLSIFCLFCLLEFNLKLKSFFNLIFILLKITFNGKPL